MLFIKNMSSLNINRIFIAKSLISLLTKIKPTLLYFQNQSLQKKLYY